MWCIYEYMHFEYLRLWVLTVTYGKCSVSHETDPRFDCALLGCGCVIDTYMMNWIHAPRWRHQIEAFSALLAFARGIHRPPVNSPHKGQWRGASVFSLICAWINGWVNTREAGYLRRYRAYYDVTVMQTQQNAHCACNPMGCAALWCHMVTEASQITDNPGSCSTAIQEYTKAPHYLSFAVDIDRWPPNAKGQWYWKRFHDTISSWDKAGWENIHWTMNCNVYTVVTGNWHCIVICDLTWENSMDTSILAENCFHLLQVTVMNTMLIIYVYIYVIKYIDMPNTKSTHWGRVTHICVSKLAIIGSDNWRQAILWNNAGI